MSTLDSQRVSAPASLYRRHRPRNFADVVGQEHVVRTLENAVTQDKVHHAYLFVGSRGTGKTSMAKILASCLNCENGPTISPCGTCESCVAIAGATSLDVIEMDAASNNSVDDVRDLREKVAYAPVSGRHKVYILDEAHMLSSQAWNAFLKTLEEPPPRTIFVLATTEAQKVLPTVVDRCHRFDFARPSVEQVATVLRRVAGQESIAIDEPAVALLARHATGSFRDALGTLEQLVTYTGERAITAADALAVLGVADSEQLFEAVDAVCGRDPAGAMRAAASLADSGRDPGQVLRDLEVHARELLAVQILGEVPAELRVTAERDERLRRQAATLVPADTTRLLDLIAAALGAMADGAQPRIQLELVLVKAASPDTDPSVAALLARIEQLERSISAGAGLSHSAPAPEAPRPSAPPASPPPASAGSAEPRAVPAPEARAVPAPEARAVPAPEARAVPAPEARDVPEADPPAPPPPPPPPPPAPPERSTGAGAGAATVWPAVVSLIRDGNQMLATVLSGATPLTVSETEFTAAFASDNEFFKRKAEQDEHRRSVQDALRQVTGRALTLRYELRDPEQLAEAAAPAMLSGEELVQRFMEEFDAEEILDDDPKAVPTPSTGEAS